MCGCVHAFFAQRFQVMHGAQPAQPTSQVSPRAWWFKGIPGPSRSTLLRQCSKALSPSSLKHLLGTCNAAHRAMCCSLWWRCHYHGSIFGCFTSTTPFPDINLPSSFGFCPTPRRRIWGPVSPRMLDPREFGLRSGKCHQYRARRAKEWSGVVGGVGGWVPRGFI